MSPDTAKKILFVDDEPHVLSGIRRHLRGIFEVDTATSSAEGLEMIEDRGHYAVVVSDLHMDEMDGMEFLREVRRVSPDSVCVVLTGYADLEVAVEAVNERRIYRFLTKPCPGEKLIKTLNECLEHYLQVVSMSSYTYTSYIEDGVLVWTDRSQGCLAVTGYCAQDFVRDKDLVMEIVLPDYREKVKGHVDDILMGKEVGPFEFKICRRDGEIRWLRDTIIPHRNDDGVLLRFDGLVEDVTEAREMESALQDSEARYQRMVANVPGVVFQLVQRSDGSISFVFVSDSGERTFGVKAESIKEDSSVFFDFIAEEDRVELKELLSSESKSLEPIEYCARFKVNGEKRWYQFVARPGRVDDNVTLWDGLLIDVTALRSAEKEVESLAKFPFENPNPVLRVSRDGFILYANKASEPLLKLWNREVKQKVPDDIFQLVEEVRAGEGYECIEVKCKNRYFSIVFSPISEYDYVNLYARDITEAKLAEIELRRANKILKEHDRLKSEFVSTVSHELRTPLCIFKNIISNAMAGVMGKISSKLMRNLQIADRSVDRLSRIISDFLDISKIESGTMKLKRCSVSFNTVVGEVVESLSHLAEAKGIKIKSQVPSEALIVYADRDRLIQILTNLIGNAVKFINMDGKIDLIVSRNVDEIEVCVKDNGPGLSNEDIDRIFDRFVQINLMAGPGEHGTGLGLSIAKELVEMHDGRLCVDSVVGEGSCFRFTLPLYSESTAADDDEAVSVSEGKSGE